MLTAPIGNPTTGLFVTGKCVRVSGAISIGVFGGFAARLLRQEPGPAHRMLSAQFHD